MKDQPKEKRARESAETGKVLKFTCPICQKPITGTFLPELEIIQHLLTKANVRIFNSKITARHTIIHMYDEEEDTTLEESHDVTAFIEIEFDSQGECTHFKILELQPPAGDEP